MATGSTTISALWGRISPRLPAGWRPGPALSPRILERKIALMYRRLPAGLAMGLAISSALVFILPSPDGRGYLLLWGLANVAVAALRFADRVSFGRRSAVPDGAGRRRTRLVLGAAAQGVLWGLLGWYRFPAAPLDQLFLTLVLTGMAGGGTIFLSPLHLAYVGYVVPLMVPVCVHLLAGGMAMQKTMGVLGLVYTLAMLFASAKVSRWMGDALGASYENEDLVARLKAANAGLEEHKARLEQVVDERTERLSSAIAQLREGLREKELERQRAAQSDANHISLLQAINEGFGHVDAQETFLFANPAAETIFGVAPGTLVGRSLLTFLDPEGEAVVRQETGTRNEGLSSRYLCPIILEDGRRRLLRVNASPLRDLEGRFLGSSAVFEDITERKEAEDALRTALTFNDQIISSAHEGIVVYGLDGRYKLWNSFMEGFTGVAAKDVLGKLPGEVFDFTIGVGIAEGVLKGLQGESVVIPAFPWDFPATGRSGWAACFQTPMKDSDGAIVGVVETVSDLTEWKRVEAHQRKLEAELHHSQKLESIGSLAGGVAHDMNNILGAVQAIVQTLRQKHAGQAGLQAELGVIERATTRGRDLVKGLTNFVRKELEEPEPLDLNGLVREEVELLGRTTLQKVALVMDLEEPLPAVMGERGALGGALMNLCVNALDAMPDSGTLTLRTRSLEDGRIGLSLEDTGKGMPPEVLARAMEPFFTTKAIGKGTGLGLAMVYATVKAHGGTVSIQSEVDQGTTVLLRLPAAVTAPKAGTAPLRASQAPALRILQVDDDDLILASIPMLMELQGHTVATAAGGQEALELLRGGLEVDLVILDLNMPGMNGLETLHHLRELRPRLPVLLATGYLDPATEAQLKRFGRALSLSKPFSMQELDSMLRKVTALEVEA